MMKDILIKKNNTIQEALVKLQSSEIKCLIVVNKKNVLLGTINDGDIRRAILKNAKLNFKIVKYFKKNCYFIKQSQLPNIDTTKKLRKLKINLIPIVDNNKKIVDYIADNIIEKNLSLENNKEIETIIMAGGLGTRLKPYTNILPKPLLPFRNQTIIENVINKFTDYGLNKFIISLNYKNILVKAFFKELNPEFKVSFLEENRPLGTAGILFNLKNKNKKYLISNCDVILDIDYNYLINFHKKKKFDITIVSSIQRDRIPYGVCKIKDNQLLNIVEKPEKNYFANTGLYLVNSKVFKLIKKNENISFVDLINKALKKKMNIGAYPVPSNAWIDLGQSADFIRKE
jgi:dTDP-glucose pyrophosphorylase